MNKLNRPYLFLILLLIIGGMAGMYSCSKEEAVVSLVEPQNCDSTEISYQRDIAGIINNSCAYSPCHVPGNGNYDYTRYEVVADRVRSGRFEERLLLPEGSPLHMPQGFTLDECKLYKLRLWIHQGFKNN